MEIKATSVILSCTATSFCLVALTYDRYIFICKALHYHLIMTRRRVTLISIGIWSISVLSMIVIPQFWRNPADIQSKIEEASQCERSLLFDGISIDEVRFVSMPSAVICVSSIILSIIITTKFLKQPTKQTKALSRRIT